MNSIYDHGKCKLITREYMNKMIEDGYLDLVIKYINLYEK